MSEVVKIDEWRPLYTRQCEVCGQTPCVQGFSFVWTQQEMEECGGDLTKLAEIPHQDKLEYDGTMCGVCTWGEAACLDPENW